MLGNLGIPMSTPGVPSVSKYQSMLGTPWYPCRIFLYRVQTIQTVSLVGLLFCLMLCLFVEAWDTSTYDKYLYGLSCLRYAVRSSILPKTSTFRAVHAREFNALSRYLTVLWSTESFMVPSESVCMRRLCSSTRIMLTVADVWVLLVLRS